MITMLRNFAVMTRQELAQLCKEKRNLSGLTQSQLGEKLGLPKTRISEFENGKSNLQCDTLLEWLKALEIKISYDC